MPLKTGMPEGQNDSGLATEADDSQDDGGCERHIGEEVVDKGTA